MAGEHTLSAKLVDLHYVDQQYHREHPQLLHRHDDVLELLYFTHGEGRYQVSNRTCSVQRGNMVVCNAGVKHGELAEWGNDLESYCCVYRGSIVPGLPENTLTGRSDTDLLYFLAEQKMLEYIILALYEQIQRTEIGDEVCQLLGNAVLNLACSKVSCSRNRPPEGLDSGEDALVKEIISWLDENISEPLNLQEVADHFYISTSHLSHMVKKATGISPIRYVLVRRIGEAQNLLMNSSLSVTDISACLGFEDNAYFSRSFKKLVGLTPTEYRNNFRR